MDYYVEFTIADNEDAHESLNKLFSRVHITMGTGNFRVANAFPDISEKNPGLRMRSFGSKDSINALIDNPAINFLVLSNRITHGGALPVPSGINEYMNYSRSRALDKRYGNTLEKTFISACNFYEKKFGVAPDSDEQARIMKRLKSGSKKLRLPFVGYQSSGGTRPFRLYIDHKSAGALITEDKINSFGLFSDPTLGVPNF